MAEVKWIKLSVSIPDNKKIKRIRKMPDGNNIVLFWVLLLARAGESNQKGGLFFTENVPYTDEDLAADFDFNIEFVKFAKLTLEKYKMIELYDDVIFIKNWDEYQQMDKLEKIKEQNRIRQAKYKEKQQLLANSNVAVTLPVTQGNATDIDIDLDIESNISNSSNKHSIESDFEKLWKLYPNKKGKSAALKSYKRSIKKGTTNKQIQNGIIAYKKSIAEKGVEQAYQKHGSTFFSNESWEDDYSSEMVSDTTGKASSIPYLDEKGVYE